MGIFTYVDPRTQKAYRFEHGGDAPTEQDFADIAAILDRDRATYAAQYEQVYGEAPAFDDGTALGRSWDRGVQDLSGGIGELLQTLGQRTGWEGLANYGTDWEREAAQKAGILSLEQPDPMSWRDVRGLGSGLTYVGELLGSSAPVMGLGAAGATAALLTAPVSVPTLIAGGLGATLATAPYYTGSILQGQERESGEDNVNLGTAALGGTVAAALDSASLILLGRIGLSAPILKSMSGEVGQNLTGRILTGTGAGAVTEGTTEALQEVTQMLAEGVDPASPQVQERLLDAFIGGGVLGGVLGGAGRGTFGKRPEAPPAPGATPPAATPPAATPQGPALLGLPAPATPLGLPAPATRLGLTAPESPTLGLPVPGRAESRPASETGATVIPPVQPGQSRPTASHLPGMAPDAVAVANGLGSDPQLLAAAKAIEDAGKATVEIIQKALGLSYPAARGLMVKLEGMGAVSKFAPNRPRTLTLPFKVNAIQNAAADRIRAQGEAASAEAAAKAATTMAQTTRATAATKAAKAAGAKAKAQAAASQTAAADAGVDETLLTEAQRAARDAAAAKEAAARDEAAKAEQDAATAKAAAMKAQLDAIEPKPPTPKTNAAAARAVAETGAAEAAAKKAAEDAAAAERARTQAILDEAGAKQITPEFNRNAAPGAVSGTAGQAIPQPGIRPAPGRQLETQAAAQRESVARQLSVKQKLDTQIANLESRIGTGPRLPDSLRAEAKQLGVSAKNHKASLQAELRRLRGQRFAVTSYLNSEAGRAQAAGETIANQEAMVRKAENDAARATYREWYTANTPVEIQAYDADVRGDGLKVAPVILPETGVAVAVDPKARAQVLAREAAQTDSLDPTTVEDKAKLLELLKKGARRLAGPANENARAALAYFSKTRDIADALDNISADAAMPDIPGKRVSTKREALHPYWKGTGQDAAKKAAQWVEDNLSDGAVDYMDEQIGRYVEDTAEAAGAVIDRQIKNTRANAEADEKTLGAYYKATGAIDSADISEELGVESGIFDRESLRRMDARNLGADRAALDEIGVDIGGFLRNKPQSIAFGLEAPLHPAILKALRNGNLRRALEVLSATSTDPYISELAGKLVAFVGDTKVFTTGHPDADFVARITDLLTHAETGKRYPGTYVLMDRADFDRVAANNPAYAAAIQNSVLLDEASGINAHTILHEVLHPATLKEITERPDGPVARRLEELRQQVFDTVGKEYEARGEEIPYGLTSLREFVTEALSNQEFQGLLDRLYPTTKKVTALEQMLRAITNFVRTRILGKPAKVYNDSVMITARMVPDNASVFDEVDRLTRSIFNTAPEFNVYGPLYSTAQRPADSRAALDNMLLRRRPFGLADALKTETAIDKAATGAVKVEEWTLPTILNLFTPTRNLVELAAKYFPDAERVYDNLTKNKEYAQELSKEMWNTLKQSYVWLDKHPQLEQAFHSLRTRASKQEIDPRLPEKFYNAFVVRYYKYNADGSIGKPEYRDFSSASDARDFITKINDAEAKGAATTKAKLLFTPDKDNAALHRRLKAELDRLEAQAPGAKVAYTDYLNIAERLHREAGKALKQRIEARYPGNENAYTRNTLLRDQYNKIFADRGLLAYQPLQRTGGYRISYSGVHPDTNTVEPFVHYFASIEDAMKAKEALLALPPEYKIREANTVNGVVGAGIEVVPRGLDSPYGNRQPVPATYVTDVVRTIRASAIKDAEAARQAALRAGKSRAEADAEFQRVSDILNANAEANAADIVELALNALPESSIFSAYRARTGVSGFIGDLSPLKAAYDTFENDFDTPDVSRGLFENFVDSMTQKVVAIQHQADADLVRQYLNDRLKELGQDVGNRKITERQYNNAVQYHKALTTALNNPTIRRLEMTNALNTGAYIFTLLGNASSAVMNLTGALFFVYPRLAARYGATRAAKMMLQSLRTISNSGRMRLEPVVGPDGTTTLEPVDAGIFGRSIRNYEFSGVDHSKGFNKGNNKTNALEYLVREGSRRHLLIDSLIYDYLDGTKTRFNALNKMLHWGSMPLHHVERVVRESAMVATYELELRRIADAKKSDVLTREEMEGAARTAVREAELMTGTIPSTGAPNWAQKGIMPSIAMYKRYPLAMMHLIIRDLSNAVPSKAKLVEMHGEGTEALTNALMERKIARLQSAAVLGTMALFAGAMGMPFYGMISDLWNLFFTDYDEEDFDTLVRMGIGELGSKGLLNYLFGVEFSSRIGLGDMLYRSPLRAEDQPPIWNILEGLGGPAVSLLHGWSTRSWDLYQQGEYYRALESAAPASIRSIMRAGRFVADGGAESLRGDIISEVSPGQALAQALGFAPSAYIRQVELNSVAKRLETGIAQRKQNILRKLNLARRNGDSDAYNAALEEKDEFNARHPDDQITGETIRKSRKTFQRTSEKVRNGIVFSDPQNYSLQEIMTLMDEPASVWDK